MIALKIAMSPTSDMEIAETTEHGVILRFLDIEVADAFEDFLTEECYVFFNVGLEEKRVSFYFGQASAVAEVRRLYEHFLDAGRNAGKNNH